MSYTPLFYYDLVENACQRWNMIHLNNDGLRHNKTIESFSSSHSSNLQCNSACCLKVEMSSSSALKLGSRAAGNIALNWENTEKEISSIPFGNSAFFLHETINPFHVLSVSLISFIWIIRFQIRLKRKRYPIQSKSKKCPISAGLDSKTRILYTTASCQTQCC